MSVQESTQGTFEKQALVEALSVIAERESEFTERFYESFFERRPDTRDLFGLHSLSEQEEMMAETLRSLLAASAAEPWLAGNLASLGASHEEYGVVPDMYASFADVFCETAEALAESEWKEAWSAVLGAALAEVSAGMLRGTKHGTPV